MTSTGQAPGPDPHQPDHDRQGDDVDSLRQDNGLRAATYVPLADIDAQVGRELLTALGRARIAAYLAPTAGTTPATGVPGGSQQRRLYVASDERVDARTIVAAAVRALTQTADSDRPEARPPGTPQEDVLAGIDTDAVFESMIADWHVDTHTAIKQAERDLSQEDADWRARLMKPQAADPEWLDDDHYVPPPPPPLPRLHARTVLAIVLVAASIVLLGWGLQLGLPGNLGFVLGIVGILAAGGILLSRLRRFAPDEDDDGSAV